MDDKKTVTEQIDKDIESRNAQSQEQGFAESTAESQRPFIERAEKETMSDLLVRGFRDNAISGVADWVDRAMIPNDPNFKIEDHWDEIKKDLPMDLWDGLENTSSLEEARAFKEDALEDRKNQAILGAAGVKGVAGSILGGIIDVDAPLMFLSGGTYTGAKVAAMTAKAGIGASRVARAVKYGAAGAEAGIVTTAVNAAVRPEDDWAAVPMAGLAGMAFGTVVGASRIGRAADDVNADIKAMMKDETGSLKPPRDSDEPEDLDMDNDPAVEADAAIAKAQDEFVEAIDEGSTGYHDHTKKTARDDVFYLDEMDNESFAAFGADELIKRAEKFDKRLGLSKKIDRSFEGGPLTRAAGRFYRFLSKSPVTSDMDALLNSKSILGRVLGFKMLESSAGIVRNNRSAAVVTDVYTRQVAAPVTLAYPDLFKKWVTKNTNDNPLVGTNKQSNINAFNNAIMEELQYRYHDNVSSPKSSAEVIEMADKIDLANGTARKVMKGSGSDTPVRGSENLEETPGWFRQRWRGDKMISIMRDLDAKFGDERGQKMIEESLAASYRAIHKWDDKVSLQFAKAVVRRAMAQESGIDTSMYKMLDQEGSEYMKQFMKDSGFTDELTEKLIAGLKGKKTDANKQSFLKQRKDVDLREQIQGTEYRLMDLIDNDIIGTHLSYSRGVAGAAGLARQGIQKADKKLIIDAILKEQAGKGDNSLTQARLDGIFSYFEGGAFAGGINPWARRGMQLTNLSLLNALGIPQLAEVGVQIAAVGWDNFVKAAPKELREMLGKPESRLTQELKPWVAFIDGEHRIFQDHLMMDETRAMPGMYAETGQFLDRMLAKGRRVQGYLSGFYKIKQFEQRTAVRGMIYRLADAFRGKGSITKERLYDLGFTDDAMVNRMAKYFTDGTVQFKGNDGIDDLYLNFDKWDPEDVFDFTLALNRHAHQVVQQAMRGETSFWMHSTEGSLLMHLKSFPVLAMQKQLIRNAKVMDSALAMSFIYGSMTAALAYSAGQALKGRDENLTPSKVMKGAFNMSNMTGWLPMMTDPVASMLGMDDLRFNNYGAAGVGGSVVGAPPMFETLNRIAHAPSAAVKLATGNATSSDIYALQATPIIGNAYGFSAMFNGMRDDMKAERRKAADAKRKEKVQKVPQPKPIEQPKPDLSAIEKTGLSTQ